MRFAVGYQQPESGEPFSAVVSDYLGSVSEVYFPWPGMATGRSELGVSRGAVDWGAQEELLSSLRAIRGMGVRLDILFNATCYGDEAIGASLSNRVCSILDYLGGLGLLPEVATTASPFIATVVRRHFPEVELRASVNMRLDSTLAMEYLGDLFDSFYLRRDLQRDLSQVEAFSVWARRHGKGLCLLANSGCLRFCPYQSFHDNLVSHNGELSCRRNVPDFQPHLCWRLYRDRANFEEVLRASWIRPEDLRRYEPLVDVVKLATRQHPRPRMVIGAYASGRYGGNLLDLLEPTFAAAFAPYVLDNASFPSDWAESGVAGACAANCTHCGRCAEVLARVLRRADGEDDAP